jgi:hypothetical protein
MKNNKYKYISTWTTILYLRSRKGRRRDAAKLLEM